MLQTSTQLFQQTAAECMRMDRLAAYMQQRHGIKRSALRIVRSPLRISPLGAHIDHQLGRVTGMAVDRTILLAYVAADDDTVTVDSLDFPKPTSFQIGNVPPYQKGDWGNYLRGAVIALQKRSPIRRGLLGVIDSDMPIGGLSSSAAVTIAYLLALESVNDLAVAPEENIKLVTRTEHEYVGLNNGILDQTSILFSQRNQLTVIDCQHVAIERTPTPIAAEEIGILAVHSGVTVSLVGTGYNNRVSECQEAARQLLTLAGCEVSDNPRLRHVPPTTFASFGERLPVPLQQRARHFFGEMERVAQGEVAWRAGDLCRFGDLVAQSGHSSIHNYECGCPQLITLYGILSETPGVYGARFSGAGFRGSCLALIDPSQIESIAEAVHQRYPQAHPEEADQYSVHFCRSSDGASLLENL